MSSKPIDKKKEKTLWTKKIAERRKLEAELELRRMFNDDETTERPDP